MADSSRTTNVAGPLEVPVFDRNGVQTGTVSVDPADFGGKINKQLMHDVVLMYQANQRAGTHSTLRRGEVAGSTKKLFRQKGTGNARVGPRRSPKRRGGGTAKGPKPRDYEYHLPKKAVRAATRMAILSKFQDQEAAIVEDFPVAGAPKTKDVVGVLKALAKALKLDEVKVAVIPGAAEPSADELRTKQKKQLKRVTWLIGTAGLDPSGQTRIYRSARNIRGVELLPVNELNTYAILKQKRLLLTKAAFDALRKPATV
jgi:large subunit ribosomal protein L4